MTAHELTSSRPAVRPGTKCHIDLADAAERFRIPTIVVLVVGLGIWAFLSRQYGEYLFPSPGRVARGLLDIISTGQV